MKEKNKDKELIELNNLLIEAKLLTLEIKARMEALIEKGKLNRSEDKYE